MSYVKLCGILYQNNPDSNGNAQTIIYQEDCNGNVIVNNISYPITFECEVIDWESVDEFNVRGPRVSFVSASATLSSAPGSGSVRQAVFSQLVGSYPTLVI